MKVRISLIDGLYYIAYRKVGSSVYKEDSRHVDLDRCLDRVREIAKLEATSVTL